MSQMTQVTCTDCEKTTEVPFTPTAGRPVYCDECFKKKRSAGAGGRGGPRGAGGRGGPRGPHREPLRRKPFSRGDYPGHERFQ